MGQSLKQEHLHRRQVDLLLIGPSLMLAVVELNLMLVDGQNNNLRGTNLLFKQSLQLLGGQEFFQRYGMCFENEKIQVDLA